MFLLSEADSDDKAKIVYIYEKFHYEMLRYTRHKLQTDNIKADAEDIVQEAFLKIVKYIDSIDTSIGDRALRVYIFSVLINTIYNTVNKKKKTVQIDDTVDIELVSDDDSLFFDELFENESENNIAEAISKLSDTYKIVLLYRYRYNMPIGEIADIMEIPVNTVKSRILRGKRLLYEILFGS